jgi:hypothetical protein
MDTTTQKALMIQHWQKINNVHITECCLNCKYGTPVLSEVACKKMSEEINYSVDRCLFNRASICSNFIHRRSSNENE